MLIHARASTPPPPCTLTPKKIVYSIRKNEKPASSSQNEGDALVVDRRERHGGDQTQNRDKELRLEVVGRCGARNAFEQQQAERGDGEHQQPEDFIDAPEIGGDMQKKPLLANGGHPTFQNSIGAAPKNRGGPECARLFRPAPRTEKQIKFTNSIAHGHRFSNLFQIFAKEKESLYESRVLSYNQSRNHTIAHRARPGCRQAGAAGGADARRGGYQNAYGY